MAKQVKKRIKASSVIITVITGVIFLLTLFSILYSYNKLRKIIA